MTASAIPSGRKICLLPHDAKVFISNETMFSKHVFSCEANCEIQIAVMSKERHNVKSIMMNSEESFFWKRKSRLEQLPAEITSSQNQLRHFNFHE